MRFPSVGVRSLAPRRRRRKGNYAVMFAATLVVMLGFGALAVDVSWMHLVQAQAQDVADAASQAAMIVYKRTGDTGAGNTAALGIVARNPVGGGRGTLESIDFGYWETSGGLSTFVPSSTGINAVQVAIARVDDDAVGLFLGRIFGWESFNVRAKATSAQRDVRVLLVMDITGSWHEWNGSQVDFNYARTAAVNFLDELTTTYGTTDKIGMVVFTGRYAWEFTPFRLLETEATDHVARNAWSSLNVASKAGRARAYPGVCKLNGGANQNNFGSPLGGCYPNMPREYTDEPGTDHTTGLELARRMFDEEDQAAFYRAMIVLTDGAPNGLGAGNGAIRAATGYTESRWEEYKGPVPHTTYQIKNDSVAESQAMWDELRVNTWVVSFVQDEPFMPAMCHGDGYYSHTNDSSVLVPIFEKIARSLPLAIVE